MSVCSHKVHYFRSTEWNQKKMFLFFTKWDKFRLEIILRNKNLRIIAARKKYLPYCRKEKKDNVMKLLGAVDIKQSKEKFERIIVL